MLDQNTFTETIRAVQDIIRTSAEPMTREEILSYFKDMDLNAQQEEMVLEFLSTPHDDPQPEENEPETKEAEYEETAEKEEIKESSAKKESAKDSVTDNISTSPMFQMYLEELKDIPETETTAVHRTTETITAERTVSVKSRQQLQHQKKSAERTPVEIMTAAITTIIIGKIMINSAERNRKIM